MENKRFTIKNTSAESWVNWLFQIYDHQEQEFFGSMAHYFQTELEDVCNLLNELHEENQSLKKFIKELTNE